MPFADDPLWEDSLTYSGLEIRRQDAMWLQSDGTAGGAVPGIRPGDIGLAVSVVSSTITVTAGVASLFKAGFGVYRVSNPSSWTGTLTAANATNPRIDLVYVRVWDNAEDSSGLFKGDVVYLTGTAAPSPVAPTPGALEIYIPLATISVPQSGGGSPSVSSTVRAITVAPGGISPNASQAGTYAGQYRDGGTMQRYNGSTWEDKLYLAAAGQVNIGSSGSSASFATVLALATTLAASMRVTGDSQNRFQVQGDGKHSWGPGGSTTVDTNLYRSAVGTVRTDGILDVGGVITPLRSAWAEDNTGRTITSTTFAAASGALSTTIVVPPSGKVLVTFAVRCDNGSSVNTLSDFNAVGSTSGSIYSAQDLNSLQWNGSTSAGPFSKQEMVTSANPGETLTITAQHRVASASTGNLRYRSISAVAMGN